MGASKDDSEWVNACRPEQMRECAPCCERQVSRRGPRMWHKGYMTCMLQPGTSGAEADAAAAPKKKLNPTI